MASLRFPRSLVDERALPSYLPVPPQDRVWGRERGDLLQERPADRLPSLRERPAFRVGEAQAFRAESRAQHAVLGEEVIDSRFLASLQKSRDQQDEELQRRAALLVLHRADHRLIDC